jgi:hypothetical protein
MAAKSVCWQAPNVTPPALPLFLAGVLTSYSPVGTDEFQAAVLANRTAQVAEALAFAAPRANNIASQIVYQMSNKRKARNQQHYETGDRGVLSVALSDGFLFYGPIKETRHEN